MTENSNTPQAQPSPGEGPTNARDPQPVAQEQASPNSSLLAAKAQALDAEDGHNVLDGEQAERQERRALRRVPGLSTELADVTEVEYRSLRLERVILAGLWTPTGSEQQAEGSLRELAALAETAGSRVLDGILQRRDQPDPGTYLGQGKAQQLRDMVAATEADTVIVDGELAPSQRRSLEDIVNVKVVDRTALILDIFAQHAKSREGKAQVELAQLEYLLPRLRGWGESMSRQAGGRVGAAGGGIGSRGPGETKIELDRRRIRTRMAKLRRQIRRMKTSRDTKRAGRHRHQVPSVAIAGYTNAGKSSLLNRLTRAEVLVENALFATLDPTVRRTTTPQGRPYTLTDTVGFVRALPTQLVEAFRSTLEELSDADLILHIVDASHPDPESQIRAVEKVLAEVEAKHVPQLLVFNKVDALSDEEASALKTRTPEAYVVSAHTGEGIEALNRGIDVALSPPTVDQELLIPYERGDVVNRLYRSGVQILAQEHRDQGTWVSVRVEPNLAAELEPFDLSPLSEGA